MRQRLVFVDSSIPKTYTDRLELAAILAIFAYLISTALKLGERFRDFLIDLRLLWQAFISGFNP
jgi:hypothetical protein